jgi:hypothetical protein
LEDGVKREGTAMTTDNRSEQTILFNREEIDLFRQWFDVVQDIHPGYLERGDFVLAAMIYKRLRMRVPKSIASRLKLQPEDMT